MKIFINIKNASGKKLEKKEYNVEPEKYGSGNNLTVSQFIEMLVNTEVSSFNEKVMSTSSDDPDKGYEYLDSASVLRVLSEEEIEEGKSEGKISFGTMYNRKIQDEKAAFQNALVCFKDGMIALFADGKRYTDPDETIGLKEGSEITLVRLTFLSGRMW